LGQAQNTGFSIEWVGVGLGAVELIAAPAEIPQVVLKILQAKKAITS